MGNPLSQLSFREPELGLWWCKKKRMYFERYNNGGTITCAPGDPVIVVQLQRKLLCGSWLIVFPDGSTGWVDWNYNVNGRWSKKFEKAPDDYDENRIPLGT